MNLTPAQLAQRAKDLDNAYASIEIPDLVREDVERSFFLMRSTMAVDANGRVDPYQTIRNEGVRMAWVGLFKAIAHGRRPADDPPTHAVSETAESQ